MCSGQIDLVKWQIDMFIHFITVHNNIIFSGWTEGGVVLILDTNPALAIKSDQCHT